MSQLKHGEQDLATFNWEDPFLLEAQLTDDERMLRDEARAFAQGRLQPRVVRAYAEETTDPNVFPEMGEAGLLGITIPEDYGGLGELRNLRPRRPRDRAGPQRLPLDDVSSELTRDVSDLCLWLRGAAQDLFAQACERAADRLFRSDGAGCRL